MREKADKIWMNGKLVKWRDAHVHVLSHALHYGSAIFEGVRCYHTKKGTAIFRMKDHIDRLYYSARKFNMKLPFSKKMVTEATKKLVKVNKIQNGYIRHLAFFGYGTLNPDPIANPVHMSIAGWPVTKWVKHTRGIKLMTSSYQRISPETMLTDCKIAGNYANSILAKNEANKKGFDETLLFDKNGFATECSIENIFIVRNNKIKTPTTTSILPGFTRDTIMQLARDLGYSVKEVNIPKKEILQADECFVTSTAAEVAPVQSLDKKKIGPSKNPITTELQKEFSNLVRGINKAYKRWLTLI